MNEGHYLLREAEGKNEKYTGSWAQYSGEIQILIHCWFIRYSEQNNNIENVVKDKGNTESMLLSQFLEFPPETIAFKSTPYDIGT